MFKRRDIPPVLLLLLLIILVMLTLSQILVVHNGRYGKNVHSMRKLQLELRQMDLNLHALMMQNVPSIELNKRLLTNEINSNKVAKILAEASKSNPSSAPSRVRSPNKETAGDTDQHHHTRELHSSQQHPGYHDSMGRNNTGLLEASPNPIRTKEAPLPDTDALPIISNSNGSQRTGPGIKGQGSTTHNNMNLNQSCCNETVIMMNNQSHVPSGNSSELKSVIAPQASSPSSSNTTDRKLKYCPAIPPGLKGHIYVDLNHPLNSSEEAILASNPHILPGGAGHPIDCAARHKVAIILPYRDRQMHLQILLSHLHPLLHRQQLDYRIIVVEQYGRDTFNKARIMNIAFVEALKRYHFQCAIFHDVDLVPEDDRNMYSCPALPRHMSVAIDEMGYKLAYQELVGGVLAMKTEHFQLLNGYSNLYWGWGAEDDDMAYRIMYVGLQITRPPMAVARYKMVKHTKRKPSDWRKRAKLLYTGTRRFQFDGLNSLQYKLLHVEERPLFTHILVDIGKPPRGFR